MITRITHFSIYVPDQDEALRWYREKLGFVLREDDARTIPGFRWVAVSPEGDDSVKMAIFKATAEEHRKKVGANTICVLATANCRETVRTLESRGVKILTQPQDLQWGVFAVFADLYGNPYNLVERRR
jgi:predicted enzyme related to lactoylglutathione lyase